MTIKSRRIRPVRHTARTGERANHTKFLSENLKGKDHLENSGVDGAFMLR
jgi:hypothetical protein